MSHIYIGCTTGRGDYSVIYDKCAHRLIVECRVYRTEYKVQVLPEAYMYIVYCILHDFMHRVGDILDTCTSKVR